MNGLLLVGFNWLDVLLGILYVSLALLIVVIAYRKLLSYLGRGRVVSEDYLVLYTADLDQDKTEYTFYFTANQPKAFRLIVLDADLNEIQILSEGTCTKEGNIVRWKCAELHPSSAYYCLETDKQKTMKRFGR